MIKRGAGMKIIKNINKNNKMPEISLENQQIIAENQEMSRYIKLEREYARRYEQSAADKLKSLQKATQVEPAPVEAVKNHEVASAPLSMQAPKPSIAFQPLQKKDEPSINDQNNHRARAIKVEREWQRRMEQSQQDKAAFLARQHGLFATPLNSHSFAAPKPKAKSGGSSDMPLILDQIQRAKAIKELREMERREQQSQMDRARRKK